MSSLSLDFTRFSAAFAAIFEIPSAADEALHHRACAFSSRTHLPCLYIAARCACR